ncbi:acyl-CoA-binding domain-containing protein 1-like isoform X1 [Salvia splendens]|uniref:acyl-CoA-binding domain-containing protein 1-like isoform X1 n=1 Tax=Salvia splendens TaxID=180675 RepID=UPI001C25E13E|nr:acyl-CoA-binding domain-containing protein 1-like isoform X1 [Salvia splendens]XP_042001903.1 acyl-CoA-binding domain-containing protein 1-like isoform X1 [Salvia splendens]
MADWHQFFQSVLLGLLTFSYLLAKLFSVILSFRDENLRITRDDSSEPEAQEKAADFWDENEPLIPGDGVTGNESVVTSDHSDSDDDWEGVESTELDKIFSVATAFIAATAADRAAVKASNDVQLQLYSLYKIAIEGPCSAPQPSALKMTALAGLGYIRFRNMLFFNMKPEVRKLQWQAWKKLGAMPREEAMEKYIDIVSELYPTWASGLANHKKRDESTSDTSMGGAGCLFLVHLLMKRNQEVTCGYSNYFI